MFFFDGISDLINTHTVAHDNKGGSYKATMHLIENSYNKIERIASSRDLFITKERLAGYLKALRESGIPVNESYIKYCSHGGMIKEEIEKSVNKIFLESELPSGLFY